MWSVCSRRVASKEIAALNSHPIPSTRKACQREVANLDKVTMVRSLSLATQSCWIPLTIAEPQKAEHAGHIHFIFKSGSRDCKGIVSRSCCIRTGCGWDRGLYAGDDFHDLIVEQVASARAVVVTWSDTTIHSEPAGSRDPCRRLAEAIAPIPCQMHLPDRHCRLVRTCEPAASFGSCRPR